MQNPAGVAGPSHLNIDGPIGPPGSSFRDVAFWKEKARADERARAAKELAPSVAFVNELGAQLPHHAGPQSTSGTDRTKEVNKLADKVANVSLDDRTSKRARSRVAIDFVEEPFY